MRWVLSTLCIFVFTGCASTTQVVEATWDAATMSEINRSSGQRSTVQTLTDSHDSNRGTLARSDGVALRTVTPVGSSAPSDEYFSVPDDVFYWRQFSRDEVVQVRFDRRNRGRGFSKGALVGAAFVGVPAIAFVLAFYDEFAGDSYEPLDLRPALVGTAVGAVAAGTLLSGLIGAAIGTKETTLFRFKGGSVSATPGGASVTIDVGR